MRPDVKVVASQLLTYIEPLRNLFVPVDNVAYKTSRKQIEGTAAAGQSGALILFPAGEVSRMSPKGIRDGHWHTGFLRLAAGARADRADPHQRAQQQPVLLYPRWSTGRCRRCCWCAKCSSSGRAHQDPRRRSRAVRQLARRPTPAPGDLAERFAATYRLGQGKPGLFASESPIALPEERLS